MRIGGIIIFHNLWKAKFFILFDVIFLVRVQGKFEIDNSQEWKGTQIHELQREQQNPTGPILRFLLECICLNIDLILPANVVLGFSYYFMAHYRCIRRACAVRLRKGLGTRLQTCAKDVHSSSDLRSMASWGCSSTFTRLSRLAWERQI